MRNAIESAVPNVQRAKGRIFVTGDTHGSLEMGRLSSKSFPEGRKLGKEDFVIVAGDFGVPWSEPESRDDAYWLDWLNAKPWTTLFVDGNHENFNVLGKLSVEEWNGGSVQRLRPNVMHLMRGEAYRIAGMSVLAFGGANSTDKEYRTEGVSWWPEEMPSTCEFEHGLLTLDGHGWSVDLVVTHCAPSYFQYLVNPAFMRDGLTDYLDEIRRRLQYKRWFFGHYHVDEDFKWLNASALYDRIIEVDCN